MGRLPAALGARPTAHEEAKGAPRPPFVLLRLAMRHPQPASVPSSTSMVLGCLSVLCRPHLQDVRTPGPTSQTLSWSALKSCLTSISHQAGFQHCPLPEKGSKASSGSTLDSRVPRLAQPLFSDIPILHLISHPTLLTTSSRDPEPFPLYFLLPQTTYLRRRTMALAGPSGFLLHRHNVATTSLVLVPAASSPDPSTTGTRTAGFQMVLLGRPLLNDRAKATPFTIPHNTGLYQGRYTWRTRGGSLLQSPSS